MNNRDAKRLVWAHLLTQVRTIQPTDIIETATPAEQHQLGLALYAVGYAIRKQHLREDAQS